MSTIVQIKDVRLYMFESCSAGDKDVVLESNYLNTHTHTHTYIDMRRNTVNHILDYLGR